MGQNKVFLLLFLILCAFVRPSLAQYDGITFKDSVYAATRTHYFIPEIISGNDTMRVSDPDAFTQVEWREDTNPIDPDSSTQRGYLVYRHEFENTGNFEITLDMVDTSGLSYFASKNVLVSDQIEVPNVFSPDDDGINDIFLVKSGGNSQLNLRIYTRNGDLIHEKIGEVVYWDGKLASGNYARQGVYYYVVTSQGSDDIVRKGFFHLFR